MGHKRGTWPELFSGHLNKSGYRLDFLAFCLREPPHAHAGKNIPVIFKIMC